MIINWYRQKDRGAIGVTIMSIAPNNSSTLIPSGAFIQESIIIGQSTNCYIFGQSAAVSGITLGAKLPSGKQFRIRGPAAFQVGSDGAGLISVIRYLSNSGISEYYQNIDTSNLLLENGNNLTAESGERLETES